MKDWKQVELEYGNMYLTVRVPSCSDILTIPHTPALANPAGAIEEALRNPAAGKRLEKIAASLGAEKAGKPGVSGLTAAITVSDNTRPVPYSSDREDGILLPLLKLLEKSGVRKKNITIVVGNGTHIATTMEWKRKALGERIVGRYGIVDHDCTSPTLKSIGLIQGIEVLVSEHFASADLRITTSLAEPHFMAGVSGGAKAVCPGLVNIDTTRLFHGPAWMGDPRATNLNLNGNPCYRFAQDVAKRTGVHFSVNCLINKEGKLTGLITGELEPAHARAADAVRDASMIPCRHEYDVIVTHGGKAAVNHYQAAKAAYCTIPVIAEGGLVVLAAHNSDDEPVGKPGYGKMLKLLMQSGPGGFTEMIKKKEWVFVPDQWQVQKWDQFFMKAGAFENLIFCTTGIPYKDLARLPGKPGYELVRDHECTDPGLMVQKAVHHAVREKERELGGKPRTAVLMDGPYGIPVI